ncbi:3-methyl-2-oxobutanoate hydroxymethyltransferase [Cohnella zeiphila]|uniref:3-methyl-2-oxobutanoate hydroxymethyltransferase n=1 Tax=Cohnella zeiphila TaxID=2761120 RepID=A0A7X0VZC8_9BACL|nr:3-methyl-2-oxobutanoate hydroxymethyltransferase [Cohnella zeiphila]MBB6733853.1 3-methyl-2-oxobutanoate hydroxymethyltransferase [Cohnella zeiphila]
MKKTMAYLHERKRSGQKIAMLTCYDYRTAVLQEEAGVDVIFVGDSVGTNVLGYESEKEVSLDEILYHLRMVKRGVRDAYLLADMPYRTYEEPSIALDTARRLLAAGADGVKLEGVQSRVVECLREQGIEVWGHLGYTPQFHSEVALQGKTFEQAAALAEGALELQRAGASMLVLELIPEELAEAVTKKLSIPTVGIASGRHTDGQVQIVNDMLGLTPRRLRHVKLYADFGEQALAAFRSYAEEVRQAEFPAEPHARHMNQSELRRLEDWLRLS